MPLSKRHRRNGGNFGAARYSARVMDGIARQVVATGLDADGGRAQIAEDLRGAELRARARVRRLAARSRHDRARHCTRRCPRPWSAARRSVSAGAGGAARREPRRIGFYGDWLRVGLGVATELPKSALTRSRDAVATRRALARHDRRGARSGRHVAITIVDGTLRPRGGVLHRSAAAAPQIRFRRRLGRDRGGRRAARRSGSTAR